MPLQQNPKKYYDSNGNPIKAYGFEPDDPRQKREYHRQKLMNEARRDRVKNSAFKDAELAHRQQQSSMQGINRTLMGGGLNPFQKQAAGEQLQRISDRGNKAMDNMYEMVPDGEKNMGMENDPYRMYDGETIVGNLIDRLNHTRYRSF